MSTDIDSVTLYGWVVPEDYIERVFTKSPAEFEYEPRFNRYTGKPDTPVEIEIKPLTYTLRIDDETTLHWIPGNAGAYLVKDNDETEGGEADDDFDVYILQKRWSDNKVVIGTATIEGQNPRFYEPPEWWPKLAAALRLNADYCTVTSETIFS